MNETDLPETPRSHAWAEKIRALFEIFLVSGFISSLLATIPVAGLVGDGAALMKDARIVTGFSLTEASITLLILLLIIKVSGEPPAALGLVFANWSRDALLGLLVVPLLFGINVLIGLVFRRFLPDYFLESNPLTELIRTPEDLAMVMVAALIAGGIKEELQRAFILNRFQCHLGGAAVGLIAWSVAFGAGHYVQGAQGVVAAGLFGLIFGILYLARRSLVAPIVAHGAYNTLAVLGYWLTRDMSP